jgi:hypothetical protein
MLKSKRLKRSVIAKTPHVVPDQYSISHSPLVPYQCHTSYISVSFQSHNCASESLLLLSQSVVVIVTPKPKGRHHCFVTSALPFSHPSSSSRARPRSPISSSASPSLSSSPCPRSSSSSSSFPSSSSPGPSPSSPGPSSYRPPAATSSCSP